MPAATMIGVTTNKAEGNDGFARKESQPGADSHRVVWEGFSRKADPYPDLCSVHRQMKCAVTFEH